MSEKPKLDFATDLKAWMRRMGYTRAQAAGEFGVSIHTLNMWCVGRPAGLEMALRKLMDLMEQSRATAALR